MIAARKLAQTQFPSSARSLSVLSAAYEFPHTYVRAKAPTAAKDSQATLENGARIVSREKDTGVVSFKVAVAGGSSTETAAQRGAAKLLAAAAFAGTATESGLKVVRDLEHLGARFSATSDREKIVYDVTVMADRVEPALATILSLVASAPVDSYLIDEEKARAALGYKSRSGCATAALTDAVHEAAYGEATAYGSNGYALNLKKLSVDEVLAYRQAHFVRENLTVVTHGGITGEAVKKIVGVHLSQFPTKGGNKGVTLPAASFVGGEVKIRADLDGKTHLAIAFPSPAGEAGKAYQVLAGVLNARAAAQGICAGAFTHSYHHGGLVGVRASGCVTSASEQLKKVVAELKAIANGAAAETDVVKTQLSLKNALNVEAGNESATAVLLSGVNAADVRGVTSAAVVDAAKAVLKTASPAFAVYGATAGVGSVQKFLA